MSSDLLRAAQPESRVHRALDIIGATYVRDIAAGELVVITEEGIESHFPFKPQHHRFCVFEYIYFARPDSDVEGRSVYEAVLLEAYAEADLEQAQRPPAASPARPNALGNGSADGTAGRFALGSGKELAA